MPPTGRSKTLRLKLGYAPLSISDKLPDLHGKCRSLSKLPRLRFPPIYPTSVVKMVACVTHTIYPKSVVKMVACVTHTMPPTGRSKTLRLKLGYAPLSISDKLPDLHGMCRSLSKLPRLRLRPIHWKSYVKSVPRVTHTNDAHYSVNQNGVNP